MKNQILNVRIKVAKQSWKTSVQLSTWTKKSQIEFEEMLFFDDCNWGDHVERIHQAHGVIGQKTPNGLTEKEWRTALEKFSKARDL